MPRLTEDDREILRFVAENNPNTDPPPVTVPLPLQVPLVHERIMVALARAALDATDKAPGIEF